MENIDNLYDVIIVGGGPAGLSAAIYVARAKYKVLVLEKEKIGGQITITSEVVNYPGILTTNGCELTDNMRKQAEGFGAEFELCEVKIMDLEGDIKTIHTSNGEKRALGVILAVGANPRKIGFQGEREFQGRGVAYCATCDGEFFTGMDLFVVGGGFAAVEEGIFLTKYAKSITMIVRGDSFSCAKTVSDQIDEQEKITVKYNTELVEVRGDGMINYARFKNNKTGEEWVHEAKEHGNFGIFVFAGYVPNTDWLPKCVEIDDHGYLITDRNQKTNLDGVYGAGDVCEKNLRQVVTAVSDGAVAATSLEKYLADIHGKLSIPELRTDEPDHPKHLDSEESANRKVIESSEEESKDDQGFLTTQMKQQLKPVFEKFEKKVILQAWLDDSTLSKEIRVFLEEFCTLSDKVSWSTNNNMDRKHRFVPSIEFLREDGSSTGIQFHGVPGGHEINSFLIALFNVAGPGKAIPEPVVEKIKEINELINIKVLVSLSCTMCPDVVMATQKIASISPYVEAEMFDIMHFPELKEKYQVMSVPCMVINDSDVFFGKKGIEEIASILTRKNNEN